MPEMTLMCGDKEYIRTSVPVKLYRRYTEIMERNGESVKSAFRFNAELLKEVFNISVIEILKADVIEFLVAAKTVHFVMQEVVTPKFLELNPDRPEQEKSAFDEYDEEEGYNDEHENIWTVCRENVDRVIKLCIRAFNDTYTQCMESDIMSLLDYVKFEIVTMKTK